MAYIGKSPTVGNFVKLDAITASATASYTMQVDSVNFSPESVNHMLVSLNGVIQAPTTSYTISGSTITFASALTSSDSIDFIMVYGNVLDIGTPSDATVTNAKTNFVSTSSASGLQIKGDGTTAGTLQLNCEQNSHGIKLKSPPHSASASYTLTFPNDDGTSGQVLSTNGSGVLSWATSSSSVAGTESFKVVIDADQTVTSGTFTLVNYDKEVFDNGGNYDTSNKKYTAPSTGTYQFNFNLAFATDGSYGLDNVMLHLAKNGTRPIASQFSIFAPPTHTGSGSFDTGSIGCSVLINLSANDYIQCYARSIKNGNASTTMLYSDNERRSEWSGYRVT